MTTVRRGPFTMRTLHLVLGVLSLGFVVLLVVANWVSGCRPEFLVRPELIGWISAAIAIAIALFWASRTDHDVHRFVGSMSSGALTGLMLGTLSLPVLIVPLSIVGCFRLPRAGTVRIVLALLVLVAAAVCVALPYATRGLTASAAGCSALASVK